MINGESAPDKTEDKQSPSVAAYNLPPPPLTPEQFAARYGKSASFGYRMIYAGRVEVLPGVRLAIPHSEVLRYEAATVVYNGRRRPRKKRAQKTAIACVKENRGAHPQTEQDKRKAS